MLVRPNHEYERKIRLAAIGCGSHALRNVFPTHRYAPVDLVAVRDLDASRAEHAARTFGARKAYTDHRRMLEAEKPDAVQIVTNYGPDSLPCYPDLAIDCLRAGAHAWIEKPPAAASARIQEMIDASAQTGRFVAVGFKKMFFPANVKAKEIVSRPEFGQISTITTRYPQSLPPLSGRGDPAAMLSFLDHMVHPWSVLRYLGGPTESIYVQRAGDGGTVTAIRFLSGAVGSLHLPAGQGAGSPMERTEVVGHAGNVIVDNNIRVSFYRRGESPTGGYGRGGSFYEAGPAGDDTAGLTWEPEFSLGQLYNNGMFLLGYAHEFRYFCQCVLDNTAPAVGNLDDALELLRIYEAYRAADGQCVKIACV